MTQDRTEPLLRYRAALYLAAQGVDTYAYVLQKCRVRKRAQFTRTKCQMRPLPTAGNHLKYSHTSNGSNAVVVVSVRYGCRSSNQSWTIFEPQSVWKSRTFLTQKQQHWYARACVRACVRVCG